MARPKANSQVDETKERLLGAASTAFGKLGYERARLEDIASEAGISRASLLYHYSSKDALYEEVLKRAFSELEQTLERAVMVEGDFQARFYHMIEALESFERQHLPLLSVILRGVLREDDNIARGQIEGSFGPFLDRLESFIRLAMGESLDPRLPLRAAILQLVFGHLVRSAMGSTGEKLWNGSAETRILAQRLLWGTLP